MSLAAPGAPAIRYAETLDGHEPRHLDGFFVGWPDPPSPETHLRLLAGSGAVVLAIDEESGNVVGFVTAITDGVLSAYIPHLEVLPDHQSRGIGTELMRRMLEHLADLYMVDLRCDEGVRPFYARLGMLPVSGMALRNYARQTGT